MKCILVSLIGLVGILFCNRAQAQILTIPDSNFVASLQYAGLGNCITGNQLDASCPDVVNTTILDCSVSGIADLTGIEAFVNLETLYCSFNQLSSLPALPSSLTFLDCSYNELTSLPALPPSLNELHCDNNLLQTLPALPNTLSFLFCNNNQLTALPALPSGLTDLACYSNQLTALPLLPSGLQTFGCSNNNLTSMPALPNTLYAFDCSDNQITSLPDLPDTMSMLAVTDNPLTCLPSLQVFTGTLFDIGNTNITCLPNVIQHPNTISIPVIDTMPICAPGDPCFIAGACAPVFDSYYANVGSTTALYTWTSVPSAVKYRVRLKNMNTGVTSLYIVLAPDTTKLLTGLTPNTLYKVQVRAQCSSNGSTLSPWSVPNYTTTSGAAVSCVPPTNPFATPTSNTSATINWTPVSGAAGYQVRYRVDGTIAWTPIVLNNGTATSTNLNALQSNTTYQYQLRTKCSNNPSTWSNYTAIQTFTTPLRLGEEENFSFHIFPNPASNIITVTASQTFENALVEVTDLCGRRVNEYRFTGNGTSFTTNQLSNGAYYLRLQSNDQIIGVKKLVVMH